MYKSSSSLRSANIMPTATFRPFLSRTPMDDVRRQEDGAIFGLPGMPHAYDHYHHHRYIHSTTTTMLILCTAVVVFVFKSWKRRHPCDCVRPLKPNIFCSDTQTLRRFRCVQIFLRHRHTHTHYLIVDLHIVYLVQYIQTALLLIIV